MVDFIKNIFKNSRYYYQIKITYKDNNDNLLGNQTMIIHFLNKKNILNRRVVIKVADAIAGNEITKTIAMHKQLHGCKVGYEVMSYIGKFKG